MLQFQPGILGKPVEKDSLMGGNVATKLLIVEDEEDVIELLSTIFDNHGDYGVLYARDGEEALRIARADNPDIILLDVQLPKLNGFKVCQLIKSELVMSHTKVLMLSGMTQNSDYQKSREVGADGYITKPFTSIELIEKVEVLLRSN